MFREHRKLFIFAIVIFALSCAGVGGYLLAVGEPRIVKQNTAEAGVPAGAEGAKIIEDATVNWDYEYEMCSHHIYIQCQVDENMVGLTFTQLKEQYPDVRIVSFEPDELSLKMSFACYCPNHYILKHYKDELAVLRTILGTDEQEIYLYIPVRFDDINEEEKQVLETGKLFDSLEELESYIENIET